MLFFPTTSKRNIFFSKWDTVLILSLTYCPDREVSSELCLRSKRCFLAFLWMIKDKNEIINPWKGDYFHQFQKKFMIFQNWDFSKLMLCFSLILNQLNIHNILLDESKLSSRRLWRFVTIWFISVNLIFFNVTFEIWNIWRLIKVPVFNFIRDETFI